MRAGTLKNKSSTRTSLPVGAGTEPACPINPPSMLMRYAASCCSGFEVSVSRETEPMDASASPRKPSVWISNRSSADCSLLVACRDMARGSSSAGIPAPSSVTIIKRLPASLVSIAIAVAEASIAFSINSLTADAGRSTTSPAAIWEAMVSERMRIVISFSLRELYLLAARRESRPQYFS